MMHKIIEINIQQTVPTKLEVLRAQGVPESATLNGNTVTLLEESISIFHDLARPRGIIKEISKSEFKSVYFGDGYNEEITPLDSIYKYSDSLALFAVTIGEKICGKIQRLFDSNDFALASMLDAAASEGADKAAVFAEKRFADWVANEHILSNTLAVTRFSPGYCGWHVSGQKKLFEFLGPETINIELNESCLMNPLKSISGVLVAGNKQLFEFSDDFLFCSECADHSCQSRILSFPEKI